MSLYLLPAERLESNNFKRFSQILSCQRRKQTSRYFTGQARQQFAATNTTAQPLAQMQAFGTTSIWALVLLGGGDMTGQREITSQPSTSAHRKAGASTYIPISEDQHQADWKHLHADAHGHGCWPIATSCHAQHEPDHRAHGDSLLTGPLQCLPNGCCPIM